MKQVTIEIKGPAGAGKSLIADALAHLLESNSLSVEVNDGDRVRSHGLVIPLKDTNIVINVEQV